MGEWQGQQVLGMRLTWNKRYITLAPIATVLGLAFKLSDPEKLTGIVCMGEWQGQQVLGMRLTWNKRYITLAPIATVLGLAFKLSDPEKLLGGAEDLGITCALIPTTTPGVEIGRRHFPLNVPFQNGPTRGKDVFVPIDYIIGGPKMAGQGWRMLVECLSVGRGITLPSNSTGGVKSVALAVPLGRPRHHPAFQLNRRREIGSAGNGRVCSHSPSVQNLYR